MITKFKIFESKEIWYVSPTGSIETYYTKNKHDKFVTYDNPEYYNINKFLEWMHEMHISFDVHNRSASGRHHFKTDAKYPCAVKFSNFTVKCLCTWTQYTIGEGHTVKDAIEEFMNIVKGKTIVSDGGNPNFEQGEEVLVPDDFEVWSNAKKYNL